MSLDFFREFAAVLRYAAGSHDGLKGRVAEVLDSPDPHAATLSLADHLESAGKPAHAEFLRRAVAQNRGGVTGRKLIGGYGGGFRDQVGAMDESPVAVEHVDPVEAMTLGFDSGRHAVGNSGMRWPQRAIFHLDHNGIGGRAEESPDDLADLFHRIAAEIGPDADQHVKEHWTRSPRQVARLEAYAARMQQPWAVASQQQRRDRAIAEEKARLDAIGATARRMDADRPLGGKAPLPPSLLDSLAQVRDGESRPQRVGHLLEVAGHLDTLGDDELTSLGRELGVKITSLSPPEKVAAIRSQLSHLLRAEHAGVGLHFG